MAKRILIDLEKFRSTQGRRSDERPPEAVMRRNPDGGGLISIREWAAFQLSCRRCTAAPCLEVCPAEALEKDEEDMIHRAPNLCVSCKSCVVICPFGTLMNDFFDYHRDRENDYDTMDEKDLELLMRHSPAGAVSITEDEADPEKQNPRLTDRILVKEKTWEQIKP